MEASLFLQSILANCLFQLNGGFPLGTCAAVDFGLTTIDAVVRKDDGDWQFVMLPNPNGNDIGAQLQAALQETGCQPAHLERIAVTGGQSHRLPLQLGGTPLIKIQEIAAIGRGGIYLAGQNQAGLEQALVVSAGSGTAMIAARGGNFNHVTGSAVGGGTLQGLSRLLLGTADAPEIDRMALSGNANAVDLTLVEAIGDRLGSLPVDANAVNFGRAIKTQRSFSPENLAAALVRMVAQVITVIAVNAARAEKLDSIIIIGHLVDLPSVCQEMHTTAGYYNTTITIPHHPGFGTAMGALLCMEEESGIR